MKSFTVYLLVLISLTTIACQSESEDPTTDRRKSPIAIAQVNHEGTYAKIVYGQPYKRGRVIFGDLVPYGEVWRTGANEATELTVTGDIMLAGERVEAGTYALFSIPNTETWTIILNSQLGQWGAFDYNADYDVMRVDVSATKMEDSAEAFTIQFEEVENDSTNIVMRWDQTEVRIPVEFIGDGGA
ncbi:DUF2911 domain-containing protein [Aliifodinibius sp. S!AR15-10]|uniref:DUF2911 domain-containing protein n=1 Tax=Aliifodinibius sp. S!AR15-10 TaxID=2950437 RepID=UPI002857E059|nr:DUF2911 domain-containing protein [Aliifodinibius sp. S!AR15-10]MDR8391327.1 DUF2911 domain-containing protein [Aliifodinibius sp. S!AR15-10]